MFIVRPYDCYFVCQLHMFIASLGHKIIILCVTCTHIDLEGNGLLHVHFFVYFMNRQFIELCQS